MTTPRQMAGFALLRDDIQSRRGHHHRRPGRLLDLPARRGAPPRGHPYPALLIIDSPLALNEAEALSAALYRRLVTLADASPGQMQFIIADNQLPATTAATMPRSTSPTTPPPS